MGQMGSRPARDGNRVAADALDAFERSLLGDSQSKSDVGDNREQLAGSPDSRSLLVRDRVNRVREYGSLVGRDKSNSNGGDHQPVASATRKMKPSASCLTHDTVMRSASQQSACSRQCCACCLSRGPSDRQAHYADVCFECRTPALSLCPLDCELCQMSSSSRVGLPLNNVVDSTARGHHLLAVPRKTDVELKSSYRKAAEGAQNQRGRRHSTRLLNSNATSKSKSALDYESDPKGSSPRDPTPLPSRQAARSPPGAVSCASLSSLLPVSSASSSSASPLFALERRKSPQLIRHTNEVGTICHEPAELCSGRSPSRAASSLTAAAQHDTAGDQLVDGDGGDYDEANNKGERSGVNGRKITAADKPKVGGISESINVIDSGAADATQANNSANLLGCRAEVNKQQVRQAPLANRSQDASKQTTLVAHQEDLKKNREQKSANDKCLREDHLVWNELAARYGRMSHKSGGQHATTHTGYSGNSDDNRHYQHSDRHHVQGFSRRQRRPSRSSCLFHILFAILQTLFPILASLKNYSLPGDLLTDLAAGFTVAVLHIPQGMAYGLLSGVEPIYGLYVSFIPVLVMSLMSKSRHVSYGTFAVISMLLVNTIDNVRSNVARDSSLNKSAPLAFGSSVSVGDSSPLVIKDNHQPVGDESSSVQQQKQLLLQNLLKQSTSALDSSQQLLTSSSELSAADPNTGHNNLLVSDASEMASNPTSIEILACVCIVCGIIHITMSLMRLGVLSLMFSDQLVSSFTTASAFHVLTSQLAGLFDLSLPPIHEEVFKIVRIWWNFGHAIIFESFNQTTALLSLSSIVFLLFVKQIIEPALRRKFIKLTCLPSELVLMAIVILSSWTFKFQQDYGVKIIGFVPTGLPEAKVPRLELVPYVIKDAVTIALISFAMNLSIAQVYAKKFRYELDANQELFALGTANIVSSFFSCFPCASSLSRSSVQSSLNVRSQLCSLFSCGIVVLIICFFAHILHDLPRSTLSCIIVVALKGILMQIGDLYVNWRRSKLDALVWIFTFLSVIIFGVTYGLILGIVASLFMIFLRLLTPNHSILGQLPGTEIFVDTNAFTECKEIERVKIFRFNSALCYLNRTMLKSKIEKLLPSVYKPQGFGAICSQFHLHSDESRAKVNFLIIDCSALSYCDYSGATTLVELIEDLEREKIAVYLAACPLKLIDMIEKMDSTCSILDRNVYPTIGDAIGRARCLLTSRLDSSGEKMGLPSLSTTRDLQRSQMTMSGISGGNSFSGTQSILDAP